MYFTSFTPVYQELNWFRIEDWVILTARNLIWFLTIKTFINILGGTTNDVSNNECTIVQFLRFHRLPYPYTIIKVCLIVHKCGKSGKRSKSLQNFEKVIKSKNSEVGREKSSKKILVSVLSLSKLWNCLPQPIRAEQDREEFKKKLKALLITGADELYRLVDMQWYKW